MWRKMVFGLLAVVALSATTAQAARLPIIGPGGSAIIEPNNSYEFTENVDPLDPENFVGGIVAQPTGINAQQQSIVLDQYNLLVVGDGINPFGPLSFEFSAQNALGDTNNIGLGDLTFTLRDTTLDPLGVLLSEITFTDATGISIPNVLSTFVLPGNPFGFQLLTLTIEAVILSDGSSYNATITPVPLPMPLSLLLASMAGLVMLRRMRKDA